MFRHLGKFVAVVLVLFSAALESQPYAQGQVSGTPSRLIGRFDIEKHPAARQAIRSAGGFPNLRENFEVLDPTIGTRYNCIAHSLGVHSQWINPATGPSGSRLTPMDTLYREKGYMRAKGLDFSLVPELKKVVLYAKVQDGKVREITHAAVQERTGTWTSKLGKLPLIRHGNPNAVSGGTYGIPVAIYVKRRT